MLEIAKIVTLTIVEALWSNKILSLNEKVPPTLKTVKLGELNLLVYRNEVGEIMWICQKSFRKNTTLII